jgi:CheY-like chemotaxis protein
MLTVINGYSGIVLAKLPQESELQGFVGEILLAGERAALLTSQLLAFSRQLVLAPRVLNLNTVVAETERMLRRLIGEDITMSTALDPQLNRVKVDQGQIIQVIMNLAVNARDAMPQGGKLTIETRNVDVDAEHLRFLPDCVAGSYVLLSVTDTGSGMSKEVRSRIFEPFFTTKGPGKGTGLGLATVYGIVKQSGGGLDVYSEPGHGTTFRVYLPAVAGQNVAAQPASVEASAQRGTETILLAEDDNSVRKIIVAALGRLGYVVLAASRGSEALELARMREGGIQLLLTDLIMPEMNGRQLAEAILPLLPDVKVLYMSGYTDDTVVRHGLVANKVAFLQKPFTPTSLAQKVREVLDQD